MRDGDRNHTIKCGYGWVSGTGDSISGVKSFNKAAEKLTRTAFWVRAGGQANIKKLVEPANRGLRQEFPDLPPLTAEDFWVAEHFNDGPRIASFHRKDDEGTLVVRVEQKADGSSQPLSVEFNDQRRDVETPPIVRGLDLGDYPLNYWTKSGVYQRRPSGPGESGRFYRPKDGFEYKDPGVAKLSLWVHQQNNVFYVEHSDGTRRKVYGPIPGDPEQLLQPLVILKRVERGRNKL